MARNADARMVRTLVEDTIAAIAGAAADGGQSANRTVVRTVYAALEGVAWLLADHVAGVARDTGNLSAAEEMALSERGYQVTPQGKVSEQTRFVPLPSLIRLAANIAGRVDPAFDPEFDGAEWTRFLHGLAARNRITHPKNQADLQVSAAEAASTVAALNWLLEMTERAMKLTTDALRDHTGQMSAILRSLGDGDPKVWAEYRAAARDVEN